MPQKSTGIKLTDDNCPDKNHAEPVPRAFFTSTLVDRFVNKLKSDSSEKVTGLLSGRYRIKPSFELLNSVGGPPIG